MGQDLPAIATRVDGKAESMYHLWQREQIIMLLSQTHFAKDIYFCNNSPEDTADALLQVLSQRTQFTAYMQGLLNQLIASTGLDKSIDHTISLEDHPFRLKDIPLPQDTTGCCYLLVSCPQPTVTYIGQTKNLPERLRQHNSGCGSNQTQSAMLCPWALFGYVVGFGGSTEKLRHFEKAWQNMREQEKLRMRRNLSSAEVASCATKLIHIYQTANDSSLAYRYVQAMY